MTPQLCIGTAQFGLNYGITNHVGKIPDDDIKTILSKAHKSNIFYIDTAQNYGSSEKEIGKYKPLGSNFKIVSKLSSLDLKDSTSKFKLFQIWNDSLNLTLQNLKVEYLDSLLVHNAADFSKSYRYFLLEWLESLKAKSIVKKIGVSIYSAADLNNIPLEKIDIIQLPFSIYDQRLLKNGTLKKLSNFNISIHIRSIFLQGLILNPSSNWPLFINKDFRHHHEKFCKYLTDENMNILDFIFWFLSEEIDIEAIVIGISSLREFEKVLKSYQDIVIKKKYSKFKNKFKNLDWNVNKDLDPRKWNK